MTSDTRLGVDIATMTLGLPFRKNVIPEIYRKKWNSRKDNPLPGFTNFMKYSSIVYFCARI